VFQKEILFGGRMRFFFYVLLLILSCIGNLVLLQIPYRTAPKEKKLVIVSPEKNVSVKSAVSKPLKQKTQAIIERLHADNHGGDKMSLREGRKCPPQMMAISRVEDVFAGWIPRLAPRDIVILSPYDCEEEMLLLKAEVMGQHARLLVVGEPEFSNSHRPRTMCFNSSIADAYSAANENNHSAFSVMYLPIPGAVSNFQYWEQEVYIKNQLGLALVQNNTTKHELQDDALIIFTDMDEFISGDHMRMLQWFDHPRGQTAFRISLRWSYYGFEWVNPKPWEIGAIVSWAQLKGECGMQSNNIRFNMCRISSTELLPMIGWHCSWCFPDTRQFIRKIENGVHSEYDQSKFKDLTFLKEQRSRGLWFVDSQPNGCFDANASLYIH